jgi:hypothetical protein
MPEDAKHPRGISAIIGNFTSAQRNPQFPILSDTIHLLLLVLVNTYIFWDASDLSSSSTATCHLVTLSTKEFIKSSSVIISPPSSVAWRAGGALLRRGWRWRRRRGGGLRPREVVLNFGDDRFFVKYTPRGDLSVISLHHYFFRRSVGTRRYILHFTPSDCGVYGCWTLVNHWQP